MLLYLSTFRAENSNTSRHLSRGLMVETRNSFRDLYDMDLAECFGAYLKYVLETCPEDMGF